ncbi:MAG TPA: SIS domain-containing protein [Candidatus Sulfotelmatobacter sp.]|nr:SIS domain-containing protein [Candidatus Sulfotelmatobacter sp.]
MITRSRLLVREHIAALRDPLATLLEEDERIDCWAAELVQTFQHGGRLLAAGNGGSAAQAQHLSGEFVGRYREDRPAFSVIALHGEGSGLTALVNDFGIEEMFSRQVRAHGRPGDIFMALSTSGASGNLIAAAKTARAAGLRTWALTGPSGNPLAAACDDALCVPAPTTAAIQEIHLIVIHMLCEAFDAVLAGETWFAPRL